MNLMPALPESIFDVFYLTFAILCGFFLLKSAKGQKLAVLFGCMTLILGWGDAFHLVPRILNYWTNLDLVAMLGIGKLVTSITMTVFYLLLEYARIERYSITGRHVALYVMWGLAVARITLCLFPQNEWTAENPSLLWGIIRNIPFLIMGILTVCLWFKSAKKDKILHRLWIVVLLSFGFYLPVVIWAQAVPIIGMLMLPKTVMYIIMIVMFKKAVKE